MTKIKTGEETCQGKILQLKNISAGYNGKIVLKNINLSVYERDFLGIIGANGSGKTTLLKVILGLVEPLAGSILFFDQQQNRIGYMPQTTFFDKKFPISVADVVGSGLIGKKGFFKFYSSAQKESIDRIMDQMGIHHLRKRPVGELSGGQVQRVFLARALVSSPTLLILDEPHTSVDKNFETNFFKILEDLNKTITIILVSHDIGIISSYVKSIACISETLHLHRSQTITQKLLDSYNCPIDLITHGDLPHRVLGSHSGNGCSEIQSPMED